MSKLWIDYPVGVPFGNPNYDVGLGGSHDMTFLTPPNTEIFQLAPGTISNISAPSWGEQVCIELDEPIDGHKYFGILHLAAVNSNLHLGMRMEPDMIVGWSGGCVQSSQYNGTHNPTGQNFLNSPAMSSQPQVGIALHDGPSYGGIGWKTFPPIDTTLDPNIVVENYRNKYAKPIDPTPDYGRLQFETEFCAVVAKLNTKTGIANMAYEDFLNGKNRGPALTKEYTITLKSGKTVTAQSFGVGMYVWYGNHGEWFGYKDN